jgi:hypothetical protein
MTRKASSALVWGAVLALAAPAAFASSHREAPGILRSPQVDGTDFYMFRSYEAGRAGFVTLIADYNPLQDPYGGPNYFPLDPDAFYDIHIDNDGDAVEDLTFRFRFRNPSPGIALPVGGKNIGVSLLNLGPFGAGFGAGLVNQQRSFTLRVVEGPVSGPTRTQFATFANSSATRFGVPFDNIGTKSIPDYASYASAFIHDVDFPDCGTGRVFVGQRKEPFAVNLGEVFDLVNLNPVGPRDGKPNQIDDANITSLILEVPISCLTGGNGSGVIGGWTTAWLPRVRTLTETPTYEQPDLQSGDYVQVSRLGHPLINEVIIGLKDKNRFNASRPKDDPQFLDYVTNPWLPEALEILFGVQAPNNFPRQDLVAVFLTGVPGLNQDGSVGEVLRLNTSINPVPAGQQNNLGVFGGDNAGFPNGRRPGDDVVDIELRGAMGAVCHAFPGAFCNPADAPSGTLPYTDGTLQDASQFDSSFPYLRHPLAGSPSN